MAHIDGDEVRGFLVNFQTCKGCGEERHRSEFYRDSRKLSGIRSRCERCCRAQNQGRPITDVPRRYRDQASYAEIRAEMQPPKPTIKPPHVVHLSIPLPRRGSIAESLLRPPFRGGLR